MVAQDLFEKGHDDGQGQQLPGQGQEKGEGQGPGQDRAYAKASNEEKVRPRDRRENLDEIVDYDVCCRCNFTVTEARLIGVNPYSQPGSNAYKGQAREMLRGDGLRLHSLPDIAGAREAAFDS